MIPILGRRTIQLATISFLFVGFIFTSSSALAYWQEVTVVRDVEIVTIGEPVEIVVADINEGVEELQLVPAGYIIAVGDVEEVQLRYEVGVSRELINTVNLNVYIKDILINGDNTYADLVEIDILGFGDETTLDLYNDVLTIMVAVRLIEPIDEQEAIDLGLDPGLINVADSVAAYEAIHGQQITFTIGFNIEQKPEQPTE